TRDRVLSKAELATVLNALDADPPHTGGRGRPHSASRPFADIIRLLILTGQRRQEIGGLRWSEVDLDRGLIVLPPARSKNNRLHELPISTQVRAILERQPRRSEFVFGRRWLSWGNPKASLDRRLNGMAEWRLHDLRRSCAT